MGMRAGDTPAGNGQAENGQAAFRSALIAAGLLIPTGVDGLYGRSGVFEDVVERFDDLITARGRGDGADVMRFPPALARDQFERSGYLKSFPHLAGTVHAFGGDERAHQSLLRRLEEGEEWTEGQTATNVVLTPAACYPVYPTIAERGPLPADGALVDVCSYCFRHEPSLDPARMQLFRMREYVRAGTPEPIVNGLFKAATEVMRSPQTAKTLEPSGVIISRSSQVTMPSAASRNRVRPVSA